MLIAPLDPRNFDNSWSAWKRRLILIVVIIIFSALLRIVLF